MIKENILVFGDSILDRYTHTKCTRISPEAPVPVLDYVRKEYRLGGAANVALGVKSLGGAPLLATITGNDENGEKLIELLNLEGINHLNHSVQDCPTTHKERIIVQSQQIARIDTGSGYTSEHSRVISKIAIEAIGCNVSNVRSIIISDYNKGTCENISELIKIAKKKNISTFVDPKTKDVSRYRGCFLLKPNFKEFCNFFEEIDIDPENDEQMTSLATQLMNKNDIDNIVVTLGASGCFAMKKGDVFKRFKYQAREIFDVCGAGDTFLSCLALECSKGKDIYSAAEIANYASAVVIGKLGTASVTRHELDLLLHTQQKHPSSVLEVVKLHQSTGKSIVFTNGCFDILHAGHLHLLNEAKKLGDILVVGINTDESVRAIKGSKRPINSLRERMSLLNSLEPVDYVCPFDEHTPERLIKKIVPDVLVKGGDYNIDTIVGAEFTISNGGLVKVIDFVEGKSSTRILQELEA